MDDKDEIEFEIIPQEDGDFDEDAEEVVLEDEAINHGKEQRMTVGLLPVLAVGLMATLLGAVGGTIGTQFITKAPDYSALKAEINQDVDQSIATVSQGTTATIETLRSELSVMKRDLNIAISDDARNIETLKNNIATVLETLESRIKTLEDVPPTTLPEDIAAIKPATLSALQKAQEAGFNWPDVSGLDAQTTQLQAEIETLRSEIETLKARPISAPSNGTRENLAVQSIANELPEFPLVALLQGAKKNTTPKSLLQRTLDKHIRVADPDDPVTLIKKAQKAYESGNYRAAATAFDQLPAPIQAYGREWRDALEVR